MKVRFKDLTSQEQDQVLKEIGEENRQTLLDSEDEVYDQVIDITAINLNGEPIL